MKAVRGTRWGIIIAITLLPAAALADFDIPSGPRLIAHHAGATLDDDTLNALDGAALTGATGEWAIEFPTPWSHAVDAAHAVIGVMQGTPLNPAFPIHIGENLSFVHAALGPSVTNESVSIPAPLFGDPATPSGTYTLFVFELPETKYVCHEGGDDSVCNDVPYTDQDFIDYLSTDTSVPDASLTYPPLGFLSIMFTYTSGAAPLACASNCFSNVLFLPGIKGSVLKKDGETLWPPAIFSTDVPQLALDQSGESVNDIQVDGIINDFSIGPVSSPIYSPFSSFMDGLVADDTINEWLPLAYDWRYLPDTVLDRGIETPSGTLDVMQEIEVLAANSKSGKVTIVAHSMGGLMGKAIVKRLQDEGKDDLVDSFVMIGSPQLGTPQAVAALMHGDDEGIVPGLILRADIARVLAQNMPGAYNLLPSAKYFDAVADPPVVFDPSASFAAPWMALWGSFLNLYPEFADFLTGEGVPRSQPPESLLRVPSVLNATILGAVADSHARYDDYAIPNHIRVVQVAGWGRPTTKAVEYRTNHGFPSYETVFTAEGDGTVVYPSTLSTSDGETYYFDIKKFRKEVDNNTKHVSLLSKEPVNNIVRATVEGKPITQTNYIVSSKPLTTEEETLLVSTHSPVVLSVYDSHGNLTGIDPNQDLSADILKVKEDIPGSSFLYTSEAQHLFLPKEGTYNFIYKGTGSGPTTVTVENFSDDAATPIAQYSDIPTTPQTSATFAVTSSAPEESVIHVDTDGNGTVDESVAPDGASPSLNDLITTIKQKILALDVKDKLKQNLVKKIDSLEKKIVAKKQKNAKILANMKTKITNSAVKGKIDGADANAITALLEQLEAQAEDVTLDAAVLTQIKEKIASLNVKANLKNDLLKRVTKLENETLLTKSLANLLSDILKKASKGKIADTDAQMLIDLIGQIEGII